jgi:hypothetical protein
MQLVLVFTIIFSEIFFRDLLKVLKVIRAFFIHTFVNNEMLTILLMNESIVRMRTSKDIYLREPAFRCHRE